MRRLARPAIRRAACLLLALPLGACGDGEIADAPRAAAAEARHGGEVVTALTAEPRTFQPLLAMDTATRAVLDRLHGGLVRLDHRSGDIVPDLAESWQLSEDGTLRFALRRDVRFSDGEPFDADDVVFSLRAALDPEVGSAHAESLRIAGVPIEVAATDPFTVEVVLPAAHPSPLRLFLAVPMLPSHLLADTDLATSWPIGAPPESMAGLGPFRLLSHVPGERLVVERNPHYWRRDERGEPLPYLDRLVFVFVADETAKALRFRTGETHLFERIPPDVFADLEARSGAGADFEVQDLGPGLGFTFAIFNLNDVDDAAAAAQQRWFRRSAFRRAVSLAIDRPAIARLVYQGRATPVAADVSPANQRFYDVTLERGGFALDGPDLDAARAELRSAGFTFDESAGDGGAWLDELGNEVAFTLVTNTSNAKRAATATLIQEDLRRFGLDVTFVGIEFGDLVQRLTSTFEYDLLLLEFGVSDTDPSSALDVWRIDGGSHFFHLGSQQAAFPWEAEIDRLMRSQAEETDPEARRRQVQQVQQIAAREVPFVFLVAPNVLVASARGLMGVAPSVLDHPTLWHIDEAYWLDGSQTADAEDLERH